MWVFSVLHFIDLQKALAPQEVGEDSIDLRGLSTTFSYVIEEFHIGDNYRDLNDPLHHRMGVRQMKQWRSGELGRVKFHNFVTIHALSALGSWTMETIVLTNAEVF